MVETIELRIRNVSCDACEKVIGRMLRSFPNAQIESFSKDATKLHLSCEPSDIPGIKGKLSHYNFLDETPDAQSYSSFVAKHILDGKGLYRAEHALLVQTLTVLIALLVGTGALYFVFFQQNELFRELWPIFLLVPFGIATTAGAFLHIRCLRNHFSCSSSMMAGMIMGMISGFMGGAVLGATNGMFIGSVGGMAIGMGVSAWAVRKNGVMGVLEGLMAGLMAGTMGAMLSVMMITDNLLPFLYILFAVSVLILVGLSYFIIREIGPIQEEYQKVNSVFLILATFVILLGVVALAMYGPKSTFVFGGFV